MSASARQRSLRRRTKLRAARLLVDYAGAPVQLVGAGPPLKLAAAQWRHAVRRHRAFWLADSLPPQGATVRQLHSITGVGKKQLRARLRELEASGAVRGIATCGETVWRKVER